MRAIGSMLAVACLGQTGINASQGEAQARSRHNEAIQVAVFRKAALQECKYIDCLLSVGGNGISDDLFQKLKDLPRVRPALRADLELEDGAYKGFSAKRARILDISGVKWFSPNQVAVDVNSLTSVFHSRTCRYHLELREGMWTVDVSATVCPLS